MTTVREALAIAERRPDAVKTLTLAERREGLLRLAEAAVQGAIPEDVLPPIVHHLALASGCGVAFDDLRDAVRDRNDFEADPSGFADTRDWPASSLGLDALCDRIASNIDYALARLLGET